MWRQPLPIERLDRAHPLAPDLACLVANQGPYGRLDYLGNAWATEGTPTERLGRNGLAVRFTTGQAWTNTTITLPTTSGSVVMVALSESSADQGSVFGAYDSANAARFQAHFPYSGTVYWDFGGTTDGTTRLSYTPSAGFWGAWRHMAFTAGPRGMAIYEDGVLKASHSTAASRSASSAAGFYVGRWLDSNTARIESLFLYSRQLSAAEVGALFIQPYQMFSSRLGGLR